MDEQRELEALQKDVMAKAAAHLQAVRALPDNGAPSVEQLQEAHRTKEEWQAAMAQMNALLEAALRDSLKK
jgi:phospholipase/lecithinase/hemolysin